MDHTDTSLSHPSLPARAAHPNRRIVLSALAGGGIGLAWHRVAAQEATPVLRPPVAGATFIGVTSDPDTFVAVVEPYAESEETQCYLCDGHDLSEWCTGPTRDVVILQAEEGTTVTARLDAVAATGKVELPDGRLLSFVAERATGPAGLYDVELADGTVSGSARDGQRLVGQVVEKLADGRNLLAGTIAEAAGQLHAFATFVSADAAGEMRWIVLADGRVTGARKEGLGTGWADPEAPG
jgi:hypothetical protein